LWTVGRNLDGPGDFGISDEFDGCRGLAAALPEFLKWFTSRLTRSVHKAVACRVGNNFPLCIGVHQNALTLAAQIIAEGDLAIHRFIRDASAEIASESEIQSAGFPDSLFCNFNTPAEWEQFNR